MKNPLFHTLPEFPIILYTVLNENPLKDFFKSQKGALYHIMLLAEIERLNHHKWFNLSSMKIMLIK